MKQRLFIAIKIPEEIRFSIIKRVNLPENFKITKSENLHITLLFLGDTDEEIIPEIIDGLQEISANFKAFVLDASRFDSFSENGYPRIIYFTGDEGRDYLYALAKEIRDRLKRMGFVDNKNFRYHVTVARMKYRGREKVVMPDFDEKLKFRVDGIILYRSDLKPAGPDYTELWKGELESMENRNG